MKLIIFFIAYFLFLLASSVVITAFYAITRGYTEILPDGTENRYGKILKGYFFFWFRERGRKKMYYSGDELAGLVNQMRTYFTAPILLSGDPFLPATITAFETTTDILYVIPLLRHSLQVKFEVQKLADDKVAVLAYHEDPDYVFPEWLRTVMAGCITCTPTVYGNITYWAAICLFRDTVLYDALFGCFGNIYAGIILVWIAYWLSLAWLNTVLWHIYDK